MREGVGWWVEMREGVGRAVQPPRRVALSINVNLPSFSCHFNLREVMENQILDYTLVPAGLLLMAAYHIWLLFRILHHPNETVIGVNSFNRRFWVTAMMEDVSKYGVLAVQTLRNNIMASSVLASTAIMLSSLVAALMAGRNGERSFGGFLLGETSVTGISIKFFAILVCFLISFLLNVQSIRYYSHASILINVPFNKMSLSQHSLHLMADYVGATVNKGSYFWSLGLRAFYFSCPLTLWLFGPIPMFCSSLVLVFFLYFLDITIKSTFPELEDYHHPPNSLPKSSPPASSILVH